jgi:hypothetical protein
MLWAAKPTGLLPWADWGKCFATLKDTLWVGCGSSERLMVNAHGSSCRTGTEGDPHLKKGPVSRLFRTNRRDKIGHGHARRSFSDPFCAVGDG